MIYVLFMIIVVVAVAVITTVFAIRRSMGWYLAAGGFLGGLAFVCLFFVAGFIPTTAYQDHTGDVHWLMLVSLSGAVVCFFITFAAVITLIFGSMAKNTGG